MDNRESFSKQLATIALNHPERAIAFLWFYRKTQQYEERTASELASDLHDEGFPKPNVTHLHKALHASRFIIKGKRPKTFQIDVRRIQELDGQYDKLISFKKVEVSDAVIPIEWVRGTRPYLEQMVHQINGAFDYGFYDASAVLCRRLMETLIIEVYCSYKRQHEIQQDGIFFALEKLAAFICSDKQVTLSRNSPKTMKDIKGLGDTAAHDRTYITPLVDMENTKLPFRRLIQELMTLANIKPRQN